MPIYDDSHCDTYEEYCEEILAYMRTHHETFDFGEGDMQMTLGENGMYKIAILHYLNEPYYEEDEFRKKLKTQRVDRLHRDIEAKFDELSNEKLSQKLHNRYDNNIEYRKRMYDLVKGIMSKRMYPPYYIDKDENGSEYVKSVNRPSRSKDRKRKYKRNKQSTLSYQHYCEYCERIIIYDEETLCDGCYLNFEAEGILVYNLWQENWIWANNDFSDYELSDGHWRFDN